MYIHNTVLQTALGTVKWNAYKLYKFNCPTIYLCIPQLISLLNVHTQHHPALGTVKRNAYKLQKFNYLTIYICIHQLISRLNVHTQHHPALGTAKSQLPNNIYLYTPVNQLIECTYITLSYTRNS